MLGRAHKTSAIPRSAGARSAAKRRFAIRDLWRLALWGSTAAVALFVATLTSRSDVGSQRIAAVMSALHLGSSSRLGQTAPGLQAIGQATPPTPRQFDAESAARQLAQAVRGLMDDRDRLAARLAAVEHNMEDVTGSVTQQLETFKTAARPNAPWPDDTPPALAAPVTPEAITGALGEITPAVPASSATLPEMPSPSPPSPPPSEPIGPPALATAPPAAYGIELASAPSIQTLHARWAALHTTHPLLFEGLRPVVVMKELRRSNRVELQLVAGPFSSAEAAQRRCVSLAVLRLPCQPTSFDGRGLPLQ